MTDRVPSKHAHVYYEFNPAADTYDRDRNVVADKAVASVVSSEIEGTGARFHTIMLDLDVPATLVPSSTEGHTHLYIDVVVGWRRYRKLLRQLAKAGVIEEGFYKASLSRRGTHLRLPWVKKEQPF